MTDDHAAIEARLASLERTVRGNPEEGHAGILGALDRQRRVLYFAAGMAAISGLQSAPGLVHQLVQLLGRL